MATVDYDISTIVGKTPRIVWDNLLQGDTGLGFPIVEGQGALATVEIGGTFGTATVTLKVSNTGTYYQAKDVAGTNISTTSAALFEFRTGAALVRPEVSGGDGTTNLFVVVTTRG